MFDKAYIEETHPIDTKEYEYLTEQRHNKISTKIRKIYFNNEINYLNGVRRACDNFDRYSINITDFDSSRYQIERQSYREGTYYSTYTYLDKTHCLRMIQGDTAWMRKYNDSLIREMAVWFEINQPKVGVVVDYQRETYHVRYENSMIFFDSSIRSSYDFTPEGLFDPELKMQERLGKHVCVMTYRQKVMVPRVMANLLNYCDHKMLTVSES